MGVDHGGGRGGTSPPEFGAGGLSPRFWHVAEF